MNRPGLPAGQFKWRRRTSLRMGLVPRRMSSQSRTKARERCSSSVPPRRARWCGWPTCTSTPATRGGGGKPPSTRWRFCPQTWSQAWPGVWGEPGASWSSCTLRQRYKDANYQQSEGQGHHNTKLFMRWMTRICQTFNKNLYEVTLLVKRAWFSVLLIILALLDSILGKYN